MVAVQLKSSKWITNKFLRKFWLGKANFLRSIEMLWCTPSTLRTLLYAFIIWFFSQKFSSTKKILLLIIINNCLSDIKNTLVSILESNKNFFVRKHYKTPVEVDDDLQNRIAQVFVYKISPFSEFAWVLFSQKKPK